MPWQVDPKYLDAAEQQLAVKFPPSFRHRMSVRNGGSLTCLDDDWRLYPIADHSATERLRRTADDVVRNTIAAREMPWFPTDAVAVAHCNSDLLVLLPEKLDAARLGEAVYVWRFDTGGVERVADSIEELLV